MKRILALFLALCCCFCLPACGDNADNPISDNTGTTDSMSNASESVFDSTDTTEETLEALNVPVYSENDILIDIEFDGALELGEDASSFKNFSGMARTLYRRLQRHPTEAVREREDGLYYIVYDTDTGYRAYRFYTGGIKKGIATGFVIVIDKQQILSYSDFKNIKVGDSILAVEAIDSVATLHKKKRGLIEPNLVEALARYGIPWTTVHYLTDGILKINYTSPEQGVFLVSEIIYDENYNITGMDGIVVNHKIEDIDLPVS